MRSVCAPIISDRSGAISESRPTSPRPDRENSAPSRRSGLIEMTRDTRRSLCTARPQGGPRSQPGTRPAAWWRVRPSWLQPSRRSGNPGHPRLLLNCAASIRLWCCSIFSCRQTWNRLRDCYRFDFPRWIGLGSACSSIVGGCMCRRGAQGPGAQRARAFLQLWSRRLHRCAGSFVLFFEDERRAYCLSWVLDARADCDCTDHACIAVGALPGEITGP
jgi:hypothetical protein